MMKMKPAWFLYQMAVSILLHRKNDMCESCLHLNLAVQH